MFYRNNSRDNSRFYELSYQKVDEFSDIDDLISEVTFKKSKEGCVEKDICKEKYYKEKKCKDKTIEKDFSKDDSCKKDKCKGKGKMKEYIEKDKMADKYKDKFDEGCCEDKYCESIEECIEDMTLGQAYVPYQKLCKIYDPKTSLSQGTVFPELDKPYSYKKCKF